MMKVMVDFVDLPMIVVCVVLVLLDTCTDQMDGNDTAEDKRLLTSLS